MNRFLQILSFMSILWVVSVQASDFQSPRTSALGGAGHASPLLGDAIYLNPSFTSFMSTHSLSYNYQTYGGGTVVLPDQSVADLYGHIMNLSVLDGTADSLFQAGIGYTRREDASLLHLGASKSILQRIGVGLGGKFIFPNDGSGLRINDATFSVTGIVSRVLQTAWVVDNLFETAPTRGYYREFTLGSKINVDGILLIYIDPNWVPTLPAGQSPWGYEAGIEFPFMGELFLRMGTFHNSNIPFEAKRGNGYGVGFGWLAPKLSLEYSFSRVLSPSSAMAHNFGATIYF